MLRVKPLMDRIIVERVEEKDRTDGGLHIPDVAKDKPMEGIVLAVGWKTMPDGSRGEMAVKESQRVLFGRYAGTEIKIDRRDVVILQESELLAVIEAPSPEAA